MTTFNLLEKYLIKYLIEDTSYIDINLDDYEINCSIIKLRYSYKSKYNFDNDYISYDNILEVQLLDYLTWIYNQCFKL